MCAVKCMNLFHYKKNLITRNVLNSKDHSHAAQLNREKGAKGAFSFEFKTLRLHRVS